MQPENGTLTGMYGDTISKVGTPPRYRLCLRITCHNRKKKERDKFNFLCSIQVKVMEFPRKGQKKLQ
jgi:hypothetical protein